MVQYRRRSPRSTPATQAFGNAGVGIMRGPATRTSTSPWRRTSPSGMRAPPIPHRGVQRLQPRELGPPNIPRDSTGFGQILFGRQRPHRAVRPEILFLKRTDVRSHGAVGRLALRPHAMRPSPQIPADILNKMQQAAPRCGIGRQPSPTSDWCRSLRSQRALSPTSRRRNSIDLVSLPAWSNSRTSVEVDGCATSVKPPHANRLNRHRFFLSILARVAGHGSAWSTEGPFSPPMPTVLRIPFPLRECGFDPLLLAPTFAHACQRGVSFGW